MTYYIHRHGIIKKTWLRILNVFLIVMIPLEVYKLKKQMSDSYCECIKSEIFVWKEGFKFGE